MATIQQAASVTGSGANAATTAAMSQAFRGQTQPTIKRPGTVLSAALSAAATVTLPDTQLPPTTLLRCIYLECSAVTVSNAATVAFQPDAPLNLFSTINFHDAQGTSIVGSFDSFTLSMAQKWFGFTTNSDPAASSVYVAQGGVGAGLGGSITTVFRIPVEVVSRTGVGSQINTDTQSPLVLSLVLNQSTLIYATPPTTLPTVNVVISYGGYWNQSGNPSSFATPTAVGSLNYVNWTNYTGLAGQQQFQLNNIGLGNSVMNILYINRNAGTPFARSDANFANPLQIAYRGNVIGQWSELLWKHLMSEAYGYGNPLLDVGVGNNVTGGTGTAPSGEASLNQGVYNQWFNADFTSTPGNSLFYGMLNTAVGDSIELTGNWPNASTLYEVINFLAVSGPVAAIQGH
jgi:hypothetical protein